MPVPDWIIELVTESSSLNVQFVEVQNDARALCGRSRRSECVREVKFRRGECNFGFAEKRNSIKKLTRKRSSPRAYRTTSPGQRP